MSEKLWGGRFSKTTDEMINEFQASIGFDRRMYREDIAGSLAHAAMLAKVGILSEEDRAAIEKGLKDILAQIEHGDFDFSVALEDIHMNIEKRLTDAIGDAGSRLHTARSRNDQVALDTHLFVRHAVVDVMAHILAGTTLPIDRQFVAQRLHFERIYTNSLDAVSDRDYILEFLSAASILMVHLSRLSEEIILWCSREFSFVELDDAHCTGSSMMPQKKNPDVSELVRGKTGRVVGYLMAMLMAVKGLPLAYNKDLQEDKEGLFDAIDTVKFSLAVYAQLIRGMKLREDVMRHAVEADYSNATDLADYLVRKGLPFRKAHAVAGQAVAQCIARGIYLAELPIADYQQLSPLFAEDIYNAISPETCVSCRNSYGGTSYEQAEMQLEAAKNLMTEEERIISVLTEKQNILS